MPQGFSQQDSENLDRLDNNLIHTAEVVDDIWTKALPDLHALISQRLQYSYVSHDGGIWRFDNETGQAARLVWSMTQDGYVWMRVPVILPEGTNPLGEQKP